MRKLLLLLASGKRIRPSPEGARFGKDHQLFEFLDSGLKRVVFSQKTTLSRFSKTRQIL